MPGVIGAAPTGKTELRTRWRWDAGDYVAAVEVAKSGDLCVVGAGDGHVLGLDLGTGGERFRILAHRDGVLGVAVAPDGSHFVTCGQEPHAKLWQADGMLVRELPGGGPQWVEHVAWSPSGGRIATGAGRTVRVWSAAGDPIVETEPLPSTVSNVAWRADGTALAATCYGGVYVWPFVAGAKPRRFEWKGSLISLAWSPDAKVIACGSQDCSVHFWRLSSGKDSQMTGFPFKPKSLAWDSESKLLATSGDATVTVWEFRGKGPEGTQPLELASHKGVCTRLAFSPCEAVLASGSQDSSVLLWEPRRGTKPIRYGFMDDEVTALAWHPAGSALLATDASGTVCVWEAG